MDVKKFEINGPMLITPKKFGDERGFFVERWKKKQFQDLGINCDFIQDNFSRSDQNVLRGLHYQYDRPQSKLVTCSRGRILDILLDIRHQSPTYGRHLAITLSGDEPQWVWAPEGFAHGFSVLSPEGADILYKVDAEYNPQGEGGIMWNDPDLDIDWQVLDPIISLKDTKQSSFEDYIHSKYF